MAEGIPGGTSEPVTPEDPRAFIKCKRFTYVLFFIYRLFLILYFHLFYFGLGFLLVPIDSDGNICLLEPPVPTEPQAVVSVLLNTAEIMINSVIKCTQPNAHHMGIKSFCCHREAYRGNVNIMCLHIKQSTHSHFFTFVCGVAYTI